MSIEYERTSYGENKPDVPEKSNVFSGTRQDVFEKSMGIIGRWQLFIVFLIFLSKFPISWHQIAVVIYGTRTKFSCENETLDKCDKNCKKHIFDRPHNEETFVMEWDLVCDRAMIAMWAHYVTMVGILVGNFIFSIIADKYGRRWPLIAGIMIQLLFGMLCAISPWVSLFIFCRFMVAFATGGTMSTSFILMLEIIGRKWRQTIGILYHALFYLAMISMAILFYWVKHWRRIQYCLTAPSIIGLLYLIFLPESPKWLCAKHKTREAVKVLERAARFNNMPTENISNNVMEYMLDKFKSEKIKAQFSDIVKNRMLLKNWTFISIAWFCNAYSFFGLVINILDDADDIMLATCYIALAGFPGIIITVALAKRFGKKLSVISALICSSISNIIMVCFPPVLTWPEITFGSMGISCFAVIISLFHIYSVELFPTAIRSFTLGTFLMIEKLAWCGALYLRYNPSVQFYENVTFCILPIFSCICIAFLLEPKYPRLADSVKELEELLIRVERVKNIDPGYEAPKLRTPSTVGLKGKKKKATEMKPKKITEVYEETANLNRQSLALKRESKRHTLKENQIKFVKEVMNVKRKSTLDTNARPKLSVNNQKLKPPKREKSTESQKDANESEQNEETTNTNVPTYFQRRGSRKSTNLYPNTAASSSKRKSIGQREFSVPRVATTWQKKRELNQNKLKKKTTNK